MITESEVSILRATFRNQALNFINGRITSLEKQYEFEENKIGKLKLAMRLKEAMKIRTFIKSI